MKTDWPEIESVLLSEGQIHARLDAVAAKITEHYADKPLTVLAILKGSFIFFADLLRRLPLRLHVECLAVSSYEGTESTGVVRIKNEFPDLAGRHILLLDDIFDTGRTLFEVSREVAARPGVLSVKTCVLLVKKVPHCENMAPDFFGFEIPNEFVVGYGLDYNELYRNLPYIGILRAAISTPQDAEPSRGQPSG
jgi:hypoxanthine phosphoribosyltransferase